MFTALGHRAEARFYERDCQGQTSPLSLAWAISPLSYAERDKFHASSPHLTRSLVVGGDY